MYNFSTFLFINLLTSQVRLCTSQYGGPPVNVLPHSFLCAKQLTLRAIKIHNTHFQQQRKKKTNLIVQKVEHKSYPVLGSTGSKVEAPECPGPLMPQHGPFSSRSLLFFGGKKYVPCQKYATEVI